MNRAFRSASAFFCVSVSVSSFWACADQGVDVDTQCFDTSAMQALRGGWDANGATLNGSNLNAGYLNAGYMNGRKLQGINLNGIQLNDVYMHNPRGGNNRLNENGVKLNDVYLQMPRGSNNRLNGVDLTNLRMSATLVNVQLDGGKLVVTQGEQRLRDEEIAGITLFAEDADGAALPLTITAVTPDQNDKRLAFYDLAIDGQQVCADGETGVFVSGSFDAKGDFHDDGSVSYACSSGVIHKCVLWGYAPWTVGADLHHTCTRAARADYCGDGIPWTQNGTLIDIFDVENVQVPVNDPALSFEAGWSTSGAVCVNEPRYAITGADGEAMLPSCWASKPRCASFDLAKDHGALIGNASGHTEIEVCQ